MSMNPLANSIISLLFCRCSYAKTLSTESVKKFHPLVTALSGDLSIILSAPRGGRDAVTVPLPVREKVCATFKLPFRNSFSTPTP